MVSVSLFLVSSLLLQGCDLVGMKSWFKEAEKPKPKRNSTMDLDATATCNDGKFSCTGNNTKWCDKQEKRCMGEGSLHDLGTSCTPKCTWQCATPKCDQVCAPKCNQPICTTRCKGINTASCQMQCGKPDCKVVCPKQCAGKHCAKCKTECGKPKCELKCGKDQQPCRNLCAQPQCKWECNSPKEQACPKPQCNMKCEKPRKCMDNSYMVEKLPPLMPGETEVNKDHAKAAGAPAPAPAPVAMSPASASLVQISSAVRAKASMRVNLTTMGADRSLQLRQMDMEIEAADRSDIKFAAMEDPTSTSWTRTMREHHGHVTESESSCNHGSFHCDGDMHWCKQQRKKVDCRLPAKDTMIEDQQAETGAIQALQDVDRSLFLQQRKAIMLHKRSFLAAAIGHLGA